MYISLGICMYVHARYLVDVYVLYVRRWCIHSMHQVSESQILIRNTVHVPSHVNIIIQCYIYKNIILCSSNLLYFIFYVHVPHRIRLFYKLNVVGLSRDIPQQTFTSNSYTISRISPIMT